MRTLFERMSSIARGGSPIRAALDRRLEHAHEIRSVDEVPRPDALGNRADELPKK